MLQWGQGLQTADLTWANGYLKALLKLLLYIKLYLKQLENVDRNACAEIKKNIFSAY